NRAGTIERVESRKVLDRIRLVAAQNVRHAAGFKLEDSGGQSGVEDAFVAGRVVQGNAFELDGLAALGKQLEGVVNNRKRPQPKKVHLQQAQLFDRLHVVSGDDFVVLGLV